NRNYIFSLLLGLLYPSHRAKHHLPPVLHITVINPVIRGFIRLSVAMFVGIREKLFLYFFPGCSTIHTANCNVSGGDICFVIVKSRRTLPVQAKEPVDSANQYNALIHIEVGGAE